MVYNTPVTSLEDLLQKIVDTSEMVADMLDYDMLHHARYDYARKHTDRNAKFINKL